MIPTDPLEAAFREDHDRRVLPSMRFALFLGVVLYAVFGALDYAVAHEHVERLWAIRYGVGCPVMVLVYAASYLRRLQPHMQVLAAFGVGVAGIGIIGMILVTGPPVAYLYYAGLILVLMYGYTFVRLRFGYASAAGLVVVAGYGLAVLVLTDTPTAILVNNGFFFVAAAIMGSFANLALERSERESFHRMRRIEDDREKLAGLNRRLEWMSTRDHLTGVFNRRVLDEHLFERLWALRESGSPTTVLMVDLDGFKAINDSWGHTVGDTVLRAVANRMTVLFEGHGGRTYRFGGDEFCVLFPDMDTEHATRLSEDLRVALNPINLDEASAELPVRFSAGCMPLTESMLSPSDALARIDSLLYRAKSSGKDQTHAAA